MARADDMRVTALQVEHLDNPLGIDAAAPRLAWQLAAHQRGQVQTAYRVLVASSERDLARDRGDVWDSGRVRSDRSVDVAYDGPALRSGRRYHWKVRVWDRDGKPSPWSRPGWWEMGLLHEADCRGEWIGRPAAPPTRAGGKRGRLDARDARRRGGSAHRGRERAGDRGDEPRRPGSLIGRLRIEFASGDPLVVDIGAGLKAMNVEQTGWQAPAFDDADWPAALESAASGDPPWGSNVRPPSEPVNAPVLRKDVVTRGRIARARAYVSGIGYSELRINGRRIGDRVLDPTYTEYEDTVLYTTYDATRALRQGRNELQATLAPGFYYYRAPKLLMQVAIEYADGSTQIVASDATWQVASGPTSFETGAAAEVFGGETYDARHEPSDWGPAQVVPAPGGRMIAQAIEPVAIAETVAPAGVSEPRPGTYVVDMGRTLTGWIRLRAAAARGTKVSIQYGEKLNADGTVNGVADPGPRPRWQRDEYVFRGDGLETWEPSFTFKSFRYVQLDGLPAAPTDDTVRGRVVHSAVASAGAFSSSSSLYDGIHAAMRRTMLGGMLGYPAIDPAHEKNGWAGDMQLITPAMTDNFGAAAFLTKWLGDIRDGQRADGSVSMINPIRDGCCYAWAPEWTGAYPIVAWQLYLRYGDRRVLESH